MRTSTAWVALVWLVAATSCSDGTGTLVNGGTGGGSLAGTWDIQGASPGEASTSGTLTLSEGLLELRFDDDVLIVNVLANGNVAMTRNASSEGTMVRTASAAFELGAAPLRGGGTFDLQGTRGESNGDLSIADGNLVLRANNSIKLRSAVPRVDAGTYTGRRTTTSSSIFGSLSGEWLITTSNGPGSCTAKFVGSEFRVDCSGDRKVDGGIRASVSGNVVSGSTTLGLEFSGRRR